MPIKPLKNSMKPASILALAGLMVAQSPAVWAGNESRYEAYQLTKDTFEVIADFSENAIYWCGASIFVQNELSRGVTQKIYVLRAPSASVVKKGAIAVRFGLMPPESGPADPGLTNSVEIVGNFLSAAQAAGGCTERSTSG